MGNNPVSGVDPDGRFFGKLRATVTSWFNPGSSVSISDNGNYYLNYADGSSKNFGGAWFSGKNMPFGKGNFEVGELTITQFGDRIIGENQQIISMGGSMGKFLHDNPGVYRAAMKRAPTIEAQKELFTARMNYGREQGFYNVAVPTLLTPIAIIGGGEAIGAIATNNISLVLWKYPNAGGRGLNLLKDGNRIIGFDWHKFKVGGKMVNRPHIDIPGFVRHWPW